MLEVNNQYKNSIDDAIAADKVSMEVLIAWGAERIDSHGKSIGVLRSVSAIISIVSSSTFIWMILRSHQRLSTTQHRLFLGLCISDIIFSLSFSTFNAMAPSDVDYYVWNAKGNVVSCDVMGFLMTLGGGGGLFYNSALNLYFLAVVKYKKSAEFIRDKIEPFLHGIPIAATLSGSIAFLAKNHYNSDGNGACNFPRYLPPHCKGYNITEVREDFEIPCYRGIEGAFIAEISQMILMFIPVVIMIVSLGMIYGAVRAQEKKLSRYGVGALRANLYQPANTPQQDLSSNICSRIRTTLAALMTSCKKTKTPPAIRSNDMQSQSRAVMHKAFGYSFAWFMSYGVYIIGTILYISASPSLVLTYIVNIFLPLQGFFNLLIFMYPKIMAAKRKSKRGGGETTSWCRAFFTACRSRGDEGKKQSRNKSNLRGNGKRLKKTTRNEDTPDNMIARPFGRIKMRRAYTPNEEEKCEIQVPDNMNTGRTTSLCSVVSSATCAPNIVSSTVTTSSRRTMDNPDVMVALKKEEVEKKNMDKAGTYSSVLADVKEQEDENAISNQDKEDMKVAGKENMDIVQTAASLISDDMNEQEDEMTNRADKGEMKASDV